MNALQLLKNEHKQLLSLLKEMEETSDSAKKTREKLLAEVAVLIKTHEAKEENVLYPVLENKEATHDLILEAYEEHHAIDNILAELLQLATDDKMWIAKLTVMRENLEHHIKEEEEKLFPKIEKMLAKDVLVNFAEDMQKQKAFV